MRLLLLAFLFSSAVPLLTISRGSAAPHTRHGLQVNRQGILVKDGKPYRRIGVNYFSAFYRTLIKADDRSYEAGFATLAAEGIPFCRMMGGGYWPSEQKLYLQDKPEFFRRFDAVVRSAEKNHIGLIPSLFWNMATVPDLVAEPVSAWRDPKSKTLAHMRDYVRDVVTRYRSSPAIWGWEFGNEFNLGASLPNASQFRPAIAPALGTPSTRSAKDEVSYDDIRTAFEAFAKEVRKYDADRMITTGDSVLREGAWHNWKEKSWTKDTPEQMAAMLQADNPAPVNVISIHAYGDSYKTIPSAMDLARLWKTPLFVGEFGSAGPREKSEAEFNTILKAVEDAKVPLAALWVFDYTLQDTDWNVTAVNGRAYQLKAIGEANRRIRGAQGGAGR